MAPSRTDLPAQRDTVKRRALELLDQVLSSGKSLPGLVVLDLDYTIWPLYCDCSWRDDSPSLFKDVMPIIEALQEREVPLAVASRTPTPDIAQCFLEKLGIDSLFVVKEMYPSWTHKVDHFRAISSKTGVAYHDMLFFDDEDRNVRTVKQLGVTCVLVDNGLDLKSFQDGLKAFAA